MGGLVAASNFKEVVDEYSDGSPAEGVIVGSTRVVGLYLGRYVLS